jgi:hypothetical protein
MGPVNLVVGHRQELGLRLCFIGWFGREAGYGHMDRSAARAVDYVGSPFSQEQWDLPNLSTPRESLPRTGTARRKRMPGIRELAWEAYVSCWSGFSLQGCKDRWTKRGGVNWVFFQNLNAI